MSSVDSSASSDGLVITGEVHRNDELPALLAALESYDQADFETSIRLLTPIAELGNVTAIFKLANSYSNLGNKAQAKALFRVGVDFGDIRCMNNLAGILNKEGDEKAAFRLYEMAAETGAPEPTYNFAVRLKNRGQIKEAIEWANRSLEAGYVRAPALLSILLPSESERFHKLGMEMNSITSFGLKLGQLMSQAMIHEAVELVERVDVHTIDSCEQGRLGWFCLGAGDLYHLLKRYEDAVDYFEMAIVPAHGLPSEKIASAKEKLQSCLDEISTIAASTGDELSTDGLRSKPLQLRETGLDSSSENPVDGLH